MKTKKTILFLVMLLIAGSIFAYAEGQLEQLSGTLEKAGESIQGANDIIRDAGSGGPVIYASVPSTRGRLTITGLGSYNGKYAIAPGAEGPSGEILTAFDGVSGESLVLGEIRGGSVTLNIWKVVEGAASDSLGDFNGSGQVMFMVSIYNQRTLNEAEARNPANIIGAGMVTVTFANGVATGAFTGLY